jgi:hypothetical protein
MLYRSTINRSTCSQSTFLPKNFGLHNISLNFEFATMKIDDLIIAVSYFSIPLQLVASLAFYPRLWQMPPQILFVVVLFALFVLCCGFGHLLKCIEYDNEHVYYIVNWVTAIISLSTALILLPMVPTIMSELDEGLVRLRKLEATAGEAADCAMMAAEEYRDLESRRG